MNNFGTTPTLSAADAVLMTTKIHRHDPAAVIHVPHASTIIPPDVREQFVLTDDQIACEIRLMTDHLTDELFAVSQEMATSVQFPISRLVVDPERFESDAQERMAAHGMGVVYAQTSDGRPLRRPLMPVERERLLEQWYRPHHATLRAAVSAVLDARGTCLIIDAHSFPSVPLPYEVHQDADRPDICVGTDDFHTPKELLEMVVRLCRDTGWTVAVNKPFAGALVPTPYFRADSRVRAVMIEVNRRLYLNEASATRGAHFDACQSKLRAVMDYLIEES